MIEQRYQRALQLYNSGRADDVEDACELFTQIEKEKPGYKETGTYRSASCLGKQGVYGREEKLFKEGEQLLNQKRLEEAKLKFEQASKIPLKHPKYRTQIEGYLKEIDKMKEREEERVREENERREDSAWTEAVSLFKGRDFSKARRQFEEVIRMNGKHSAEAKNGLKQIDAAEADQRAFDEAVGTYNEKRYEAAKTRFKQYIQKGGAKLDEAERYLQRIDEALKDQAAVHESVAKVVATGQNPRQVAQQWVIDAQAAMSIRQYSTAVQKLEVAERLDPTNRDARLLLTQARELAAEQPLRAGLEAYFQGKYEEAEHLLTDYLNSNNGHKRAVAYFFRGANHATRYFLSGEQDAQQRGLALDDFRTLRKEAREFQPPKKFVSSKILSLYAKAVETSAH